MSELALERIAENKANYKRGKDARRLDLTNCGIYHDITKNDTGDMQWIEQLTIGNSIIIDEGQWVQAEVIEHQKEYSPENGFCDIPSFAYNLPNLRKISIINSRVDSAIAQFYYLEEIECYDTGPIDLSILKDCKDLTRLNILGSLINDFKSIKNLNRLNYLCFERSNVNDLTPLENLVELETLFFAENQVSDLTPLKNLINLKRLRFSNNQVTELAPIKNLINLTHLDFDENLISDLTALSNLTKLEDLGFNKNQVQDLTPLSTLINLIELNFADNYVNDIRPILFLLKKGLPLEISYYVSKGISVRNNPIESPPIEIVKQGNAAILQYFEELEKAKSKGGTIRLSEAKCLILGEGGTGKTSLARKLLNQDNQLPAEKETTKGIDVHPHDLKLPDGTDFRLNIWDFGGQEIYHATHQFFLTKRSLYILLDDTRTSDKTVNDASFNYWLQIAELYGGNSPLLIVQNEKDDRSKQLDLRGMQGRFGFVKDSKATNLLSCRGLDDVWTAIEYWLKQLPHIGEEQPKAWVDIRRELERLARDEGRDHIPLEEYYRICAQHDIPEKERALFLSSYLHDFGAFLHFQDHPLLRKTLVLNNQWATDAVYKVLDCEEVKGNFGRFTRSTLGRIWASDRYADQHEELLALMEKFELCYKLPDERSDTWLAPQLLSVLQPEALAWDETDNLQIRYEYEFMPKGLLSQHIVRNHRYIRQTELAWKSGAVFERTGAQALVTEAWGSRNIRIRARGANAKELLTLLSEDFDKMHERLEGLKVRKMIPCNCRVCGKSAEPHFYKHELLQRLRTDGVDKWRCEKSYKEISVIGLLDGIFAKFVQQVDEDFIIESQILETQTSNKMENGMPVKIYVSYSNKDEAFRNKLLMHLNGLENKGVIEIWSDHLLDAGQQFMGVFEEQLSKMDIWVVLISSDSLSSKFIWPHEYKAALERKVPIVPILLKPCDWQSSPIADWHIIPGFAEPIVKWTNEDEAYLDIVKQIGRIAAKISEKKTTMATSHENKNVPVISSNTKIAKESIKHKEKEKGALNFKTFKIFLASSEELKHDRDQFEIFINRENKQLVPKGIFLELVRWEDFLDVVSSTRLQNEYNEELRKCDMVVCLFYTKVGKYTAEEFDEALGQFRGTGKPLILTYFKDAPVKPSEMRSFNSVLEFKEKLNNLGHWPSHYESLGDLMLHFGAQLKKLGIN